MKEKKILIIVLVGMAFQASASQRGRTSDPNRKRHQTYRIKADELEESGNSRTASTAEHRQHKRREADKREAGLIKKKRKALQTSIDKLERQLKDLERKRDRAADEDQERNEKEARGTSHIINRGSVQTRHLDRQISTIKERITFFEEKLEKISDDHTEKNEEEYHSRTALSKIYDQRQKDLRKEHKQVKDDTALLHVEEGQEYNDLADNRTDKYWELQKRARYARYKKDIPAIRENERKLHYSGNNHSDPMTDLLVRKKQIRKEYEDLRKDKNENADKRKKAARRAGIELRIREEEQRKKADRLIEDGAYVRPFTQTSRDIKERNEDRALEQQQKINGM